MPPYGLPKLSADPVLFLPLWLGTLRDYSGYGHTVIQTDPDILWETRGGLDTIRSIGFGGRLIISNDAGLEAVTSSTLFISGIIRDPLGTNVLFSKRDAGGVQFEFDMSSAGGGQFRLNDGIGVSTRNVSFDSLSSVAVTHQNSEKPLVYADGLLDGAMTAARTITANDSDIYILSFYNGALNAYSAYVSAIAWYPSALTAAEVAALHAWSQSLLTPRKQWPGAGLQYAGREKNLVADGDMEAPDTSAWTAAATVSLAKVPGTRTNGNGAQVMRSTWVSGSNGFFYQSVSTVGSYYRVRGWAKGDGIHPARVSRGTSVLWDSSGVTNWEYFDLTFVADTAAAPRFVTVANSAGYTDWDDIEVWTSPVTYEPTDGDPLYVDNIQTARVSLADETAGQLSNTGYTIQSGKWKVQEDTSTGERYIECISAGIISRRSNSAYGTWEVIVNKVSASSSCRLFLTSNVYTVFNTTYTLQVSATEQIRFLKRTNGGDSILFETVASYIAINTEYRFRITRSTAGVISVYIKGGVFSDWQLVDPTGGSGTNPTTDLTITDSVYAVYDCDTGDRLYRDRHYAGVITP